MEQLLSNGDRLSPLSSRSTLRVSHAPFIPPAPLAALAARRASAPLIIAAALVTSSPSSSVVAPVCVDRASWNAALPKPLLARLRTLPATLPPLSGGVPQAVLSSPPVSLSAEPLG